jgi:hypothetical protein
MNNIRKDLMERLARDHFVDELLQENTDLVERMFFGGSSCRCCVATILARLIDWTYESGPAFDDGFAAFQSGLQQDDAPSSGTKKFEFFWLCGFRAAERIALNPPLSAERGFLTAR